jgi:predicted transposase YbfD/YdcC
MTISPLATLPEHFSTLEDPRSNGGKRHLLLDIVTIAVAAVVCGAESWVEVELFGQTKQAWLRTFLQLPHGIPSHDTFGRVFERLDPSQFHQCLLSWLTSVRSIAQDQVVAVDGKTLRRSHDRTSGQSAIQMVSAWSTADHLVLGQEMVSQKSNEITAIPHLLQALDIAGCTVTADALHCQESTAETIISKDADYILAVKRNQNTLFAEIQDLFAYAERTDFKDVRHDVHQTVEKGHGRIERRCCWTINEPDFLDYVRQYADWPGLHTIVRIQRERREIGGSTQTTTHYYITSLDDDAQAILGATRTHWTIENQLHWVLDVAFREDDCRVRKGHAAVNLATLRRVALSLLKRETTARCGIKAKRLKAALSEGYLLKVLSG